VCLLDPDGDIVRYAKRMGVARLHRNWACYHTELMIVELPEVGEVGVLGCAVGSSFAVLIAEQLFASGCAFLISITSAGQITPGAPAPYFILIERALRDEGTSYHYLPPSTYSEGPGREVLERISMEVRHYRVKDLNLYVGATWTTDAPFRETDVAVGAARKRGVLAVEMEAAALYAFAKARGRKVVCFAHVTNTMGQIEGDFEKGDRDGARSSLSIAAATAASWIADG
jgi:uridine phosphorylase